MAIPRGSGAYVLKHPVWCDRSHVAVRMERGCSVGIYGATAHPAFIFGLLRGSDPESPVDPSRRVDAFGVLDQAAVPAPGRRWGHRIKPDAALTIQASHLATAGPGRWADLAGVTVEFCVEGGDDAPLGAIPSVVSWGTLLYPHPLAISSAGRGAFQVGFRTDTGRDPRGAVHVFTFAIPPAVGPRKFSVQVDLDAGKIAVYVAGRDDAGVQLAVSGGGTFPPGLRFVANEHWPCQVGGNGNTGQPDPAASFAPETFPSFRIYGLLLATHARYRDDGPGRPQLRRDGGPIDDTYRYFGKGHDGAPDKGVAGYLEMVESPGSRDRLVRVGQPGLATAVGYVMQAKLETNRVGNALIGGEGTDACAEISGANGFSQNVAVGGVWRMAVAGINSFGGWHGIGSINRGATYHYSVDNCELSGRDAGFYGYFVGMAARNVRFPETGRVTIRVVGSNTAWNNVFVQGSDCEAVFRLHRGGYGSINTFEGLTLDFEGEAVRSAVFHAENCPVAQVTLSVRNAYVGTVGKDAPVFRLLDMAPLDWISYRPAYLSAENVQTTDDRATYLDVDGPAWHGRILGIPLFRGPRLRHRKIWGDQCNVVFE